MNELGIQSWPRPWERREILREHLTTVKILANVPTDQQVMAKAPARWHGPMLMKTQKRRKQRIQAEARNQWEETNEIRSNTWRQPVQRPPYPPIKSDDEAGGSNPVPWLNRKIKQSATANQTKKVTHKELEEKIASLKTIIKRDTGTC